MRKKFYLWLALICLPHSAFPAPQTFRLTWTMSANPGEDEMLRNKYIVVELWTCHGAPVTAADWQLTPNLSATNRFLDVTNQGAGAFYKMFWVQDTIVHDMTELKISPL